MPLHGVTALVAISGETVLLKFVESILVRQEDDLVVDKLKGDVVLELRTISGKEYLVSMNMLKKTLFRKDCFLNSELVDEVLERWLWIHKS
jgi:hypothetical protein